MSSEAELTREGRLALVRAFESEIKAGVRPAVRPNPFVREFRVQRQGREMTTEAAAALRSHFDRRNRRGQGAA